MGAVVGSLSRCWICRTYSGPGPARIASASANARSRKSRDARRGSARSRRSRKAAISSRRLRFSMKYSSPSAVVSSGDWTVMPGSRSSAIEAAQQLDAANHHLALDVVHVERLADRRQQHDRERAAQMLLELDEPPQDVACVG